MKRVFYLLLAFLMLCANISYAEDYLHFTSGSMQLTNAIDTENLAKLGNIYYATDTQGTLLMTQVFTSWLPVGGAPANARIISNHRADADKLLVYSGSMLYVSYDGATFSHVKTFASDTVLRFTCGLYTAAHKTDEGFSLDYSFDGVTWYSFETPLTASAFTVLAIDENRIVLKNLQTATGSHDVLLNKSTPETCIFFTNLVYDVQTALLVESPDYTGAELIYASRTAPGKFLYVYSAPASNGYTYQVVRTQNGSLIGSSAVTASADMQLYVYADTLCLAQNGKSLNLINNGGDWIQVSDDIAFPLIRSAYNLTGDVFFDTGYTTQYYCRNTTPMPLDRSGIEVVLNGRCLAFDSEPQIMNNRTMVPVRAIAEALGYTVSFNEATREICLKSVDGVCLYMTLGKLTARKVWADGVSANFTLDASPVIVNDRTLVPLRFVSENLDLSARWIEATKTVVLQ